VLRVIGKRKAARMRILDFVSPKDALLRLQADEPAGVVRELGLALAGPSQLDPDRLIKLLLHRERVGTTAVGHELAIPHARTPEVAATVGVIGLSARGIDFHAPDGLPVHVFVALVSPIHGGKHLHALAAVTRELADPAVRKRLLQARDAAEAHQLLGAGLRPVRISE
jgi:nitrogen PTS system EIIA component